MLTQYTNDRFTSSRAVNPEWLQKFEYWLDNLLPEFTSEDVLERRYAGYYMTGACPKDTAIALVKRAIKGEQIFSKPVLPEEVAFSD